MRNLSIYSNEWWSVKKMLSDEWSYFERQYRNEKVSSSCYQKCHGIVKVNDHGKGHRDSCSCGEGQCVVDQQELHPQLGLILINSGVVLVVLVRENKNKSGSNKNNNITHVQKSRWWWEIVTNSINDNRYNDQGEDNSNNATATTTTCRETELLSKITINNRESRQHAESSYSFAAICTSTVTTSLIIATV